MFVHNHTQLRRNTAIQFYSSLGNHEVTTNGRDIGGPVRYMEHGERDGVQVAG